MSGDGVRPSAGGARGYAWPPFAEGHELSMRHGAWSERKVNPLAAELLAVVATMAAAPGSQVTYLADPSYSLTLRRWASLEARCELLRTWLDALENPLAGRPGDLDGDGQVRPAADLLTRLEAQAAKVAERLGLDPLARSKLGRDVASVKADLAQVAAAGHAALAARPADDDTADDEQPDDDEQDQQP